MNALRLLTLILATATIGACATPSTSNLEMDDDKFGGYIIGVRPDDVGLNIFPGTAEDGEFKSSFWGLESFSGNVADGYVVGREKDSARLAIIRMWQGPLFGNTSGVFAPCEGREAMTFEIEGGRVIYLGDVTFKFALPITVTSSVDHDLEAAEEFIRANYPEYSGEVVQRSFEMLRNEESCTVYY